MAKLIDMASAPMSTNTKSTAENNKKPEGFFISTNAVSEETWDEIRMFLGLTTCPHPFDETANIIPDITIDGLAGHSNAQGYGELGVIAKTSTDVPWESTPFPQHRPVAQFGFRYDYEKDVVVPPSEDNTVPKIPEVFQRLLLRPYQDSVHTMLKDIEFTQCIVNVYRPSGTVTVGNHSELETITTSSIPWHFDDPHFGPEILVFTFGESRPLHMRLKHKDNDDEERICGDDDEDNFSYFTAHPAHRSCYILSGPARHKWQHSVPTGSSWRVSITFRTLQTKKKYVIL